jgi:putative flippase GtrA
MTHMNTWLVSVAVVGSLAVVVGAALLWLLLTQPVAVAQAVAKAF